MPRFIPEAAQAEEAFDSVDKLCVGKPKSVRADASVFSAPVLDVVGEVFEVRPVLAVRPLVFPPVDARDETAAVPRHKLLQVYLV